MIGSLGRALVRAGAFARDAWLVLGATLVLLCVLEVLYLGQAAVRRGMRTARGIPEGPGHPNAAQPWWRAWEARAGMVNGPSRYDSYRGFWAESYAVPYVHVDSAGRRMTAHSVAGPGVPRVYLLGGSVMWGYTSRDSFTIPSLLGARLARAGGGRVELVNLAQPSYNATQGLITLLLELRDQRIPSVVVSLDGNNDVLAAFREGRVGAALGEGDAARQSAVGWRGFWANALGLVRFSALGDRLLRVTRPPRTDRGAVGSSPVDCTRLAGEYHELVRMAEGWGRSYGFDVFYLWQPHWATTGKPLTPWERSIRGEGTFPAAMRRCTAAVDSTMVAEPVGAYRSLTDLFDADTGAVFLDEFGHLTDAGNAQVADRIALLVGPRLRAAVASARDAEQPAASQR